MNIDSIITEWTYRLEKGYPDCPEDYIELRNVLREQTDLPIEQQDAIVRRAMGLEEQDLIQEIVDLETIENEKLIEYLTSINKIQSFELVLKSLPTSLDNNVIEFFNNLPESEFDKFGRLLYSLDQINEKSLNQIDYKSGFNNVLFNLISSGIGKGEFLLSCIFKNTAIQGKETPYDLVQAGIQYEVKDYSNPKFANSKPIRVGKSAVVTNFEFWDELTMTLKRISQLQGIKSPKYDFSKYFDKKFIKIIDHLQSRKNYILTGNLNNKDKLYFEQFYKEANALNSDIQGYTNVILRGPNAAPIEMSVEPITKTSDGTILIKPIQDDSQTITYINTELRRLKYVRDPMEFNNDLQKAVDEIVGNIQYIVFRRDYIRLTSDFRYSRIEQGAVRIVEKSITQTDMDED